MTHIMRYDQGAGLTALAITDQLNISELERISQISWNMLEYDQGASLISRRSFRIRTRSRSYSRNSYFSSLDMNAKHILLELYFDRCIQVLYVGTI